MDHSDAPAYGLWGLVIVNSLIFIFFTFSFFKPRTKTDWRTFSAFSAFIVALFVEMYGFPLTIYLLSGWLAKAYPQVDFLSHDNGHLLHTLLGLHGNPHFDVLHIASNLFILFGFILLSSSWKVLYDAQLAKALAVKGAYRYMRHPQYAAFTSRRPPTEATNIYPAFAHRRRGRRAGLRGPRRSASAAVFPGAGR